MATMEDFAFRKLVVYQHSREFVRFVYAMLKKYPKEENFALCDQLRRCVISISSNIAEGVSRQSPKDQLHFLEIAYGSLCEALCQLELSLDLSYINQEDMNEAERQVSDLARLMSGLRKSMPRRLE